MVISYNNPSKRDGDGGKMMKYWDLGEHDIIRASDKNLAKILEGILLCGGKITDSHSLSISNHSWTDKKGMCDVLFRIALPEGTESIFESLTGFKLTQPPRIQG